MKNTYIHMHVPQKQYKMFPKTSLKNMLNKHLNYLSIVTVKTPK